MFLKQIIVLCLFAALARAQNNTTNKSLNVDDFISANRRIFEKNIKDLDLKLEAFEESYLGRIKTIDTQKELLVFSLKETDEHLFTLQLLSSANRECVNKNRLLLPKVSATIALVNSCSNPAKTKLSSLLTAPRTTRNALQTYYDTTFEKDINACPKDIYESCIVNVVYNAQTFTGNSLRSFENQMDAAKCSGDANCKEALECSFKIQSATISLIANTNTLTDRCIQGLDCSKVTSSRYCENIQSMPSYMIDRNNRTMINPFYRSKENVNCMLLQIDGKK